MIRRFAWIKWIGVAVVAVTGVVQWFAVWPRVTAPAAYAASFALKMGGALGLGTITFLLALPARAPCGRCSAGVACGPASTSPAAWRSWSARR